MVKGVSILVVLSLIFLAGAVSATCSSPNQIIMKLSGASNAHGALWTDASYTYDICYDEIFGTPYTGTNPHEGTGTVLKLSGASNAHGESSTGTAYNTLVKYGDLDCALRTGACDSGESAVVSLSSVSNAHLAFGNFAGYSNKICCKRGEGINNVYWAEYLNRAEEIVEINKNRYVKMVAQTNFGAGKSLTFYVYEADCIGSAGVGCSQEVSSVVGVTDSEGIATVDLLISESLIESKNLRDNGNPIISEGDFEFFFVTKESASGMEKQSPELKVIDEDGENNPPMLTISGPEHRQIYFTGTTLEFKGECVDAEGDTEISWKIDGDGDDFEKEDVGTFTHIFSVKGQKTITVSCTEIGQDGLSVEKQIAILLLDGPGMLSFINEPSHLQKINSFQVEYDASDSYVVESSGTGCPTVACLAGDCPVKTKNVPVGCTQTNIDVTGTPKGYGDLSFKWEFDDGTSSSGLGKVSDKKLYASGGRKTINLLIDYSVSGTTVSGRTNRIFDLFRRGCSDNGRLWIEEVASGVIIEHDTLKSDACAGNDRTTGTFDDCCPSSLPLCTSNGCVAQSTSSIYSCADYTSSSSCNGAPQAIYQNDPVCKELDKTGGIEIGSDGCHYVKSCTGCEWNEEEDICEIKTEIDKTFVDEMCAVYDGGRVCLLSTERQGTCADGVEKTLAIIHATPSSPLGYPDNLCVEKTIELACPRAINVPFFGWINFIIAIIVIAGVYSIRFIKKNGK